MSRRVKELEERIQQLEDVCSTLFGLIDDEALELDNCRLEAVEMVEDARSVWLRQGEVDIDDSNV